MNQPCWVFGCIAADTFVRLAGIFFSHDNLKVPSRMNDLEQSAESVELPKPLGTFDACSYKPDGGFLIGSLFQLVGLLGLMGIVMGAIAHFIGQFFWFILLFPLLIGIIVGAAGSYFVVKFRVRNPMLCALAGFAAGVFSMLAMHYMDFRAFESSLLNSMGKEGRLVLNVARNIDSLKAKGDETPEEIRNLIKELEAEPEALKIFQIDTFAEFIDFSATQGVSIGKVGRESNIGYVGTYIYWGIEMIIVAGIALSLMLSQSKEPYCTHCDSWKVAQNYGPFKQGDEIIEQLRQGQPCNIALDSALKKNAEAELLVKIHSCPSCQEESAADVFVQRLNVDKEGAVSETNLAKITYPEEALIPLHACCTLSQTPVVSASQLFPKTSQEETEEETDADEELEQS